MPAPTFILGPNARTRLTNFARLHPGAYMRRNFNPEAEVFRNLETYRGRASEALQWRVDDRLSSVPAMWWQCDVVPNIRLRIQYEGEEYSVRMYSISSGTHKGKRVVKVARSGEALRAAGFINRDRSFTPWQSSPWREEIEIHAIIEDILLRTKDLVSVWEAGDRQPICGLPFGLPGSSQRQDSYTIHSVGFTCHVCNVRTNVHARFCSQHYPALNLDIFGQTVELPGQSFSERVASMPAPTLPQPPNATEPSATSTLAAGLPILSQLGTGHIR